MFGSGELLIVLAVVFLLFGAAKLPKLARSMGQAQKEFRQGLREGERDDPDVESSRNGALSESEREELERLRKKAAG